MAGAWHGMAPAAQFRLAARLPQVRCCDDQLRAKRPAGARAERPEHGHSLSAKPGGSFSRSVRVCPDAPCPLDTSPVWWPERVRGDWPGEGPRCRDGGPLDTRLPPVELRLPLLLRSLPRPTSCRGEERWAGG